MISTMDSHTVIMDDKNIYPIRFIEPAQLNDGTVVQLRPIHPSDSNHVEAFRGKLSDYSMYNRFLGYIPKITKELVHKLTNIDYTSEMAIVVELPHQLGKDVIAVGRIAGEQYKAVDLAIIIADAWQGKGLGSLLTDYMIEVGRDMKFEKIQANILSTNALMLDILRHKNFVVTADDYKTSFAELKLTPY